MILVVSVVLPWAAFRLGVLRAPSPLPEDGSVYPVDGPVDGNSVPLPRSYHSERVNSVLQQVLDQIASHSLI